MAPRSSRSAATRHPREHFEEMRRPSARGAAARHPYEHFEEMERRAMPARRHPYDNGYSLHHHEYEDEHHMGGHHYGRFPHYDELPRRQSAASASRQPAKRQAASSRTASRSNAGHPSREFYQEIGRKGGQARRKD
jgi:hypothetical protein